MNCQRNRGTDGVMEAQEEEEDEDSSSSNRPRAYSPTLLTHTIPKDYPQEQDAGSTTPKDLKSCDKSPSPVGDHKFGVIKGDEKRHCDVIELDRFRSAWKAELSSQRRERTPDISPAPSAVKKASSTTDVLDKAKSYFMQGIELERSGKMFEAIQSYRRSVQLVPDIERKLFQQNHSKRPYSARNSSDGIVKSGKPATETPLPPTEDTKGVVHLDTETNMLSLKFLEERLEIDGRKVFCQPLQPTNSRHMRDMPVEVLMDIFRWTVSAELDMRMLEQLSMVCAGFYLLARDDDIWHCACVRIWGLRTGELSVGREVGSYTNWRDMYVRRPHLFHNGVYISKMTYVRPGEPSLQGGFYRPWHIVIYYRYLRFFADGTALMLTSAEDIPSSLQLLKYGRSLAGKMGAGHILVGTYQLLSDSRVSAVFRRQKKAQADASIVGRPYARWRHANNNAETEQIFNLEVQINSVRRRLHTQLTWLHYEVVCKQWNGQTTTSEFDLSEQNFPPFYFSRVKSFATSSSEPL